MAVARMLASSQFQFSFSLLVGAVLALATFTASAVLASSASDRSAAAGLAIQLGGFVLRLTLVALALVVLVRFAHLQAVPLGAGLAGGFTLFASIAAARDLRRHSLVRTRH